MKKTILVMNKKTNLWARAKYLCVLPLAAVSLSTLAMPKFATPNGGEVPQTEKKGEVKPTAHKAPEYTGGQEKMMKFLQKNVKYPQLAESKRVQGRVYVRFVVEADGSLSEVKGEYRPFASDKNKAQADSLQATNVVIYDRETERAKKQLVTEAERVVKRMPKFQPGEDKDGNRVRSQMTLPVAFRLK